MSVNLSAVGTCEPATTVSWEGRDCALFAIVCGAGFESPALAFPPPGEPQQVLPAFPLALVSADAGRRPDPLLGAGDFTGRVQVLAKQTLRLHRPIPCEGTVTMTTSLSAIHDTGSAAIVVLETVARSMDDVPLFTAETLMHIAGEGGFGGTSPPRPLKMSAPEGRPVASLEIATSPVQSLLYSLVARDENGIHINPAVAEAAGLKGPILAGHNVLGMASHSIASRMAGGDAARITAISGRFTRPSYNGDSLTVRIWSGQGDDRAEGQLLRFDVVNQHGEGVLDSGECTVAPAAGA